MKEGNKISGLQFLYETAYFFARERDSNQLYQHIGICLKRLLPGAHIVINEIDIDNGILRVDSVIHPDDFNYSKITKLIGWDPVGKAIPLNDTILELSDGKIKKFEKGLHELSFGAIPPKAAKLVEKLIGLV